MEGQELVNYKDDCQFCAIVKGVQKARIVCLTNDCVSFFPLKPVIKGHTLVVPKRHVKDLWSADADLVSKTMDAVRKTGRAIMDTLNPDGINVINSTGEAASQTIFHLHIHVVPRWQQDRIGNIWPPSPKFSEMDLNETAELVRAACGRPALLTTFVCSISLCTIPAMKIVNAAAIRIP